MNENQIRDFKGIWIPKNIWLAQDLGWTEKLVLVEIDSLDGEQGCFASNEYLSSFFGLSKDRISKVISTLKNKGYITVELQYKEGTRQIEKRIIRIIRKTQYPVVKNTDTYMKKQLEGIGGNTNTPIGENAKDNNTLINNTFNNNMSIQQAEQFSTWWDLYNKKQGKAKCEPKFKALVKKYGYKVIEEGTKRYLEHLKMNNVDKQFQKNPFTFLNGEHFNDEYEISVNTKVSLNETVGPTPMQSSEDIDYTAGEDW